MPRVTADRTTPLSPGPAPAVGEQLRNSGLAQASAAPSRRAGEPLHHTLHHYLATTPPPQAGHRSNGKRPPPESIVWCYQTVCEQHANVARCLHIERRTAPNNSHTALLADDWLGSTPKGSASYQVSYAATRHIAGHIRLGRRMSRAKSLLCFDF